MKGHRNAYSTEELAWIAARGSEPRRDVHTDFVAKFGRHDVTLDAFKGLCKRKGWMTGRTGRFNPGAVPVNKGVRCLPGKGGRHPNAQRTQFTKGGLPHNTKYLGHERVSKDGYVEISVDQPNPHTGYERRYVLKHRHEWEKVNGPVPDGMMLKCLDGNRLNTDPANWELLPRATLPYLNGHRGLDYAALEPELRPAAIALAKIRHKAKTIKSGREA